MDIYTYNLCNLISKRKSSIGQNLIKIKHKVKWMVKIVKTPPIPPLLPLLLPRGFLPAYGF